MLFCGFDMFLMVFGWFFDDVILMVLSCFFGGCSLVLSGFLNMFYGF